MIQHQITGKIINFQGFSRHKPFKTPHSAYPAIANCAERIEKTALSEPGVIKVDWKKETKLTEVTFDPAKTSIDTIQKAIAKAGHDTGKYRPDDKTYETLPSCCHYERSKKQK